MEYCVERSYTVKNWIKVCAQIFRYMYMFACICIYMYVLINKKTP